MIIFNMAKINVAMISINSHVEIRENKKNIDKNIGHHRLVCCFISFSWINDDLKERKKTVSLMSLIHKVTDSKENYY